MSVKDVSIFFVDGNYLVDRLSVKPHILMEWRTVRIDTRNSTGNSVPNVGN